MKILIAGHYDQTKNYQNMLLMLGISPVIHDTYRPIYPTCSFDALLLPGGGDLHPSLYNRTNQGSSHIDASMDLVQYSYLKDFVLHKKPILGICKGMQLINIFFGGTLIQNMDEKSCLLHAQTPDGKDRLHKIYPVSSTISFTPQTVNSAHHQCIEILGTGLKPSHFAKDGVIEGIYHETLPILGLQWHPERLTASLLSTLK